MIILLIHLPKLTPFENKYIHHCIESQNPTPIPWNNNHLLVTSVRTPYVWTYTASQAPTNTIMFDLISPLNLSFRAEWIPKNSNQLILPPLTPTNLQQLKNHLQNNMNQMTSQPWTIAFFTPSSIKPPNMRKTRLTKLINFKTYEAKEYTLWKYSNKLATLLDPPLHKPLNKWAQQHKSYNINLDPINDLATQRRTIPPLPLSNIKKCITIAQPHLQYIFPSFPTPYLQPDPTIQLLGYPNPTPLHTKLLHHTQELLEETYKIHCTRYNNIKKTLPNDTNKND